MMNELTKKLLKKSGVFQNWNNEDFMVSGKQMEKFAELLIADAINTVEKRFMGDLNREDMEVRRCVADLKQHFGVE